MEKWTKRFRDRFRLLKDEQGLTQERLGELMGVSQGTIGHWLNGRRKPRTIAEFEKLAGLLNVDVSYLLHGTGETPDTTDGTGIVEHNVSFDEVPFINHSDIQKWVSGDTKSVTPTKTVAIPSPSPDRSYCFELQDSSMEPRHMVGDIVCLNPDGEKTPGKTIGVDFDGTGIITLGRYMIKGSSKYIEISNQETMTLPDNDSWFVGTLVACIFKPQ